MCEREKKAAMNRHVLQSQLHLLWHSVAQNFGCLGAVKEKLAVLKQTRIEARADELSPHAARSVAEVVPQGRELAPAPFVCDGAPARGPFGALAASAKVLQLQPQ